MPNNFNPARPQSNTRFANLSKYLQANQGEGERMGQNIAQNISGQTGQFQKDLGKEVSRSTEQLGQERSRLGQATNRASGLISGITNASSALNLSPKEVTEAGNILSDKGRAKGLDTTNLGSQANALSQIRSNIQGGSAGRQNLFSSLVKPSNTAGYTGAQQRFDTLLLEKSQPGLQQIRGASQQAGQAANKLSAAASEADIAARNQNKQFGALGDKFKADLAGASQGISDKVSRASDDIRNKEAAIRQKKQVFDTFASQLGEGAQPIDIINKAEELGLISPEILDPRYSGFNEYQAMKQRFSDPNWTRGMSDAEAIAAKNAVLGGINRGITLGADPNAISNTAAIDRTQAAQLNALSKLQGQQPLYDLEKIQAPARTQYGSGILDFYKNWDTQNINANKAAEAVAAQKQAAQAAAIANSGANLSTNSSNAIDMGSVVSAEIDKDPNQVTKYIPQEQINNTTQDLTQRYFNDGIASGISSLAPNRATAKFFYFMSNTYNLPMGNIRAMQDFLIQNPEILDHLTRNPDPNIGQAAEYITESANTRKQQAGTEIHNTLRDMAAEKARSNPKLYQS